MDRQEAVNVDSNNLHSKYARLCLEFKKLRENHAILKQALLEEREQRGSLQVKLRDSEIRIRQFDQELESLQFRNVHLSKQVEYLQMQLETERQQNSHKKHPSTTVKKHEIPPEGKDDYAVLLECDLEKRIAECAELHSRIADLTQGHEQSRNQLQKQINSLEQEMSIKLEEHRKAIQRHQTELENARDEKAALEVKLILLERDAHKLQEKINIPMMAESSITSLQDVISKQNSTDMEEMSVSAIRESDLQFVYILKEQSQACSSTWKSCISQWQECCHIRDVNSHISVDDWSQLHTMSDNIAIRLEQLPLYSLTDGKSLEPFFDCVFSLGTALVHSAQFIKETFSPAVRAYLDNEVSLLFPALTTQGRQYNADILHSLTDISDSLRRTGRIISSPSNETISGSRTSLLNDSADQLLDSLEKLPLAVKKLSRAIENKVSLIQETGVSTSDNVSQKYTALSHTLQSLKKELDSILLTLRSNCVSVQFLLSAISKKSSMNTNLFTLGRTSPVSQDSFAASIVSTNNSLCGLLIPQSTPISTFSSTCNNVFDSIVSNQATPSAADCNTLFHVATAPVNLNRSTEQQSVSGNRMSQYASISAGTRHGNAVAPNGTNHLKHLEDDRWSGVSMSEVSGRSSPYFMSPVHKGNGAIGVDNWEKRLTTLLDRVASLEAKANESSVSAQIALHRLTASLKIRNFFESLLKQHGIVYNVPEEDNEIVFSNSSITGLEKARPLHIPGQLDEESIRERLLVQHFHSRCSELHSHLELTQSQVHHFQAECYNLQARLKIEEAQKIKLTEMIEKLNLEISRVKEDLECTQENYLSNISQMTDHITSLNKQLTEQDQRLDHYKAQAQSKKLTFSLKK